ncbi:MAG: TlpA family protein disulfide reductase [Thermoleophilia bacterium]|nr:TlpA family protein disulfide reductase [Thermoleophilia bacterium]
MPRIRPIQALGAVLLSAVAVGADAPKTASVAEIQSKHDRALIRELVVYALANPKAEDADQAYMAVFDKVIEHDWFSDHEAVATRYLADYPEGAVRSLAQIVRTMARAQADDYNEALARFRELMKGLGRPEQEEFAANFSDTLASAATGAGQYLVARQVYQSLLDRYGESPALREKVTGELKRLDKVGQPAPSLTARDLSGQEIALEGYRGKYLLIDFWATWCAPCVAELPRLQAAYAKHKDRGFEILGVSLDDTKTAVVDFVKARGIPWRQVHAASAGSDVIEPFGVTTIPATFLVDPDGKIVRLELRGPALDRALEQLVGRRAAAAPGNGPIAR